MIAIADGKIVAVGPSVTVPAGATVIDGGGKYVTPGIIDTHSHLGVYAAPGVQALSDGNEATNPVTAYVCCCVCVTVTFQVNEPFPPSGRFRLALSL